MTGIGGMWRKFTRMLEGGMDDEYPEGEVYEYEDEEYEDYEYEDEIDIAAAPSVSKYDRAAERSTARRSNVLDFDSKREPEEKIVIKIISPREIIDATTICDYLRSNVICIINMREAGKGGDQRIADYLGGVCYALMGTIERIDNHIFVMVPEGVKVDADVLKEDLKAGGLFKAFM